MWKLFVLYALLVLAVAMSEKERSCAPPEVLAELKEWREIYHTRWLLCQERYECLNRLNSESMEREANILSDYRLC